ncbi:MAG: deoxyribose-phosphate aldolase [Nitrospiraceae bacterium]|nr:MAG: deoxyribose-phosphate aldolase [Nitrospiraceae bacterium]
MNEGHRIAGRIDHSLLRPDARDVDIAKLCEEAERFGFQSVCVNPAFVKRVREVLSRSKVKVTTVIGFPLGMSISQVKTYEAMEVFMLGADELDIVMNIGYAKSGQWDEVEKELSAIVTATPEAVHKIILECCYLTDREKKKACEVVMRTGAEFIKTSTGYGSAGATVQDVELIRSVTEGKLQVKAAGGIKTLKDAKQFFDAGAARLGTSAGVAIMEEAGALP